MKVTIDPKWSFLKALEKARQAYIGWGKTSTGYRNSVMMVWGSTVGKNRALNEFYFLINKYGSKKGLAAALELSTYSLKTIEEHFKSLPDDLEYKAKKEYRFSENESCNFNEDTENEFKEVKGSNPVKSIQNQIDEYIIAFLNSDGGSIYWGIADSGIVKSIALSQACKDELRKAINNKIGNVVPAIDPTVIKTVFHEVEGSKNGYVVEVQVPKSNSKGLHFNTSGNTWVKVNGCKQKLQGMALQDYIIRRISKIN